MSIKRILHVAFLTLAIGTASQSSAEAAGAAASASVSVSVAADVSAAGKVQAAAGDAAYAAGNFHAALFAYGEAFAKTRDAALIYAEAQCHQALAEKAEAEAMFKMYLAAADHAKLKYEAEAKAALGGAKSVGKKALGVVTGAAGAVADLTLAVAGGVYGVLKLSVAAELDASVKAQAEAADAAYAAAKWGEAAKGYAAAFFSSENPVALFAEAEAEAQAGHAAAARALLQGALQAGLKGKHVEEAKHLMLAVGGGSAQAMVKVAVKAKVAKDIVADVDAGDVAYKAGRYLSAAKSYGAAYAKKAEPVLLYAKGMAEYSAGQLADARKDLSAYLAAGGSLEFKVNAEVTLSACGS
jgi:hypothetical protein